MQQNIGWQLQDTTPSHRCVGIQNSTNISGDTTFRTKTQATAMAQCKQTNTHMAITPCSMEAKLPTQRFDQPT